VTVAVPGLLILVELAAIPESSLADLLKLSTAVGALNWVVLVALTVLLLFLAYCLGRLVRLIMFRLLGPWPRADWIGIVETLEEGLGADLVRRVLQEHGLLRLMEQSADAGRERYRSRGIPQEDQAVLNYCKLWLEAREHADFSITHIETEINLFVTLPVPVIVGMLVALKFEVAAQLAATTWSGLAAIAVTIVIGSVTALLIWRDVRPTMAVEQQDALRNFVIAIIQRWNADGHGPEEESYDRPTAVGSVSPVRPMTRSSSASPAQHASHSTKST
jgi:hypothetical protein